MRILLALVLSLTLVFATAAPVMAKGKSGGKSSSSSKKSSDGEEDEVGEEGEDDGGGCGSGTFIAFPILGGTVLVTRRRRWRRLP